MNKKMKQMKLKLRKADGNMALIALAIAVIIIIGMYLLSKNVGSGLTSSTDGMKAELDNNTSFSTTFTPSTP